VEPEVTAMARAATVGETTSRELDEITLLRARRGDADACRALVRRYEGPVFALLGRMLGPRGLGGLVEDVAQEVFLRVFRALPGFDPRGAARLSTWVLCIASRLAINELQRKRPSAGPLPEELADEARGDTGVARRELRRALYEAIAALTPEQQAAFVLREYHGLRDDEIARALDLEVNAVKARLHRARARLRETLSEVDRG
jgi:RNA polymerase sigma-70 factor, ECF subfamily